MHFLATIFASFIAFFSGGTSLLGTISPVQSSDTLNTLRTSFNSLLTQVNQNTAAIISTTTALTAGQVIYATSANTIGSVATSSISLGTGLSSSGTAGYLVGGSGYTINLGTVGIANGGTGTTTGGNTNGISYYDGTRITNSTGFTFTGTNVGIGSTTPAFRLSVGNAGSDLYVKSTGEVVAQDTSNTWNGRIFPTRTLVIPFATSTATWTATGTPPQSIAPDTVMPFAGTIQAVRCSVNTFLGIKLTINGSAITPSYFIASSTIGIEKATSGNTVAVGDLVGLQAGTTTTAVGSSPISGSCSIDISPTP